MKIANNFNGVTEHAFVLKFGTEALPLCVMKTYGGVELKLCTLLASAVHGDIGQHHGSTFSLRKSNL
jgi:hypothetical protein